MIVYEKETLTKIVLESKTYGEVLRKFQRNSSAASYRGLHKKIKEWNINCSHFLSKRDLILKSREENTGINTTRDSTDIFIENSTVAQTTLRKHIRNNNLLPYFCKLCGANDIWLGKKITLILDHENGIRNDNRLPNLRFLCPNCNATLKTHCRGFKGIE